MGKVELTILDGERRGEKFEFSEPSLTIGRAPDSDIVLPDPAVSSHHCEIQSIGGSFFIIDRDSSNGTWMNGREVGKVQLLPGDRIRAGDTTFVFTLAGRKARHFGSDLPVRADGPREASSPGLRSQGPLFRRTAAGVLLAVLGLGAISVLFRGAGRSSGVVGEKPIFELDLVEENGNPGNLSRSQISITDEGNMIFYFDAVGRGRHLYKEAKLDSGELRMLRQKAISALSPGGRRGQGKFAESPDSSSAQGLLTINVKVGSLEEKSSFAGDLPEPVAALRDELYMLRDRKFSFPPLDLSAAELIEKAGEAFAQGKLFYNERETRASNLFDSVCAFKKALGLLDTIEPKPDFHANAEEYHYRSQEELEKEFKSLRFQTEKAIKLMEWEKARDNLLKILARIPDRIDERHRYALSRLEKVKGKCTATR